jgi:hypothetical protein
MTQANDTWDTAHWDSNGLETELSAMELGGIAVGGVIAVNSTAVMAALAPVYTGVLATTAGGLGWVGFRRRMNLPINPFAQEPVALPDPKEATAKPVVNTQGAEVEIATL